MSAGRILVTAASRHEATMEIAAEIGAELRRRGLSADVRPIEEVDRPGRATPRSSWAARSTPAAGWPRRSAFVERHRDELAARPLWLFSSGPVGDPPTARRRRSAPTW